MRCFPPLLGKARELVDVRYSRVVDAVQRNEAVEWLAHQLGVGLEVIRGQCSVLHPCLPETVLFLRLENGLIHVQLHEPQRFERAPQLLFDDQRVLQVYFSIRRSRLVSFLHGLLLHLKLNLLRVIIVILRHRYLF